MPCKNLYCIPFHEDNNPSFDHFLNKPLKTPVLELARVSRYSLAPIEEINTDLTPTGTLSQFYTRASLVLESFLKIEVKFRSQ